MVEKLFKHMLEEKHDFYGYLMMYEHAGHDAAVKATLKTLAEQESHHFKMLYDIIFKDEPGKVWTPMEAMVKHEASEWYEEMVEELKKLK